MKIQHRLLSLTVLALAAACSADGGPSDGAECLSAKCDIAGERSCGPTLAKVRDDATVVALSYLDGKLVKQLAYSTSTDEFDAESEYFYDDGKLSHELHRASDGSVWDTGITYHSDGRLKRRVSWLKGSDSFTRHTFDYDDSDSERIRSMSVDSNLVAEYEEVPFRYAELDEEKYLVQFSLDSDVELEFERKPVMGSTPIWIGNSNLMGWAQSSLPIRDRLVRSRTRDHGTLEYMYNEAGYLTHVESVSDEPTGTQEGALASPLRRVILEVDYLCDYSDE